MASFLDKLKFGKKPHVGKKAGDAGSAAGAAPVRVAATAVSEATGIADKVLVAAHVTEKATRLGAARQYVFVVAPRATKLQVKEAVLRVYGVRPVSVNMVRVAGKAVRFGRTLGKQKDWKKAVVTLKAGETIASVERT